MALDKTEFKEQLKEILLTSTPTLFLGAGFSVGARNEKATMDGLGLKDYIFKKLVKDKIPPEDYDEIKGYNLRRLCDEVYSIYERKDELQSLLTECFKNIRPQKFHLQLTNYPWKKIYTVNIDDLVEYIYKINGYELEIQNKKQLKIVNGKTQLYKLHGCVNNSKDGYIFSESEYLNLTTNLLDAKLNNFSIEMQKNNIIFVGVSMDEPDIQYYLKKYSDAGCKYRDNKLFFIDYKPSRFLRNKVKELGATLIQASTEEFLDFITELNYKPNEFEKARIALNYTGIHRLKDISKLYKKPYKSKIYEGYFGKWQDVSEGWTFEETNYKEAKKKLDKLLTTGKNINCFSIYGTVFSGKSCLLKQLGYYLDKQGYEVLEYRGRFLNNEAIKNFINKSPNQKFALLIDGGSYYYEEIEKMFSFNIREKELIVLTASREYYHNKKKYYLEGNSYCDYKQKDLFTKEDAMCIEMTLEDKNYLSYMASLTKEQRIIEIFKQRSMINLIVGLTYGEVIRKTKENYIKFFEKLPSNERKLLIELAIFDAADIEFYPRELFTEKYGRSIKVDEEINLENMRIVDYARMNNNGLTLRNTILNKYIIENYKSNIADILISMLEYVSRYVTEKGNDTWYIIFQCLLKEDVLERKFRLNSEDIKKIYCSVEKNYKTISYYWLQFGLFEQKKGDYVSAYNDFEMSASIRPNSYKIQHAIARNYMRHANSLDDYFKAQPLFEKGEKKMKELIDSREYYKEKAKPFSVNCYVLEKVNFLNKFCIEPLDDELNYMNKSLESIQGENDTYFENVLCAFFNLLQKFDKLSILDLSLDSPYLKFVGKDSRVNWKVRDLDPIIESI